MDEHRKDRLIATYYAWGRYDSGQRSLNFTRIEPAHIERFAQAWAESQARLRAGEAVYAPGLLSAWDAWTRSDGTSIHKGGA